MTEGRERSRVNGRQREAANHKSMKEMREGEESVGEHSEDSITKGK